MTSPAQVLQARGGPTAVEIVRRAHDMLGVGAVVGHEQPFLDLIARTAELAGLPTRRAPGLVDLGAPGPVAVAAHADRHGLVRRNDGRFGYAAHVLKRAGTEGHPSRRFLAAVCGRVSDEPVFAYDAQTGAQLASGTVAHACELDSPLVVDADLPALPIGTPVAFGHGCDMEGTRIRGQLDNALGVSISLSLVLTGLVPRVLITTGEEVGRSAAHVVTHLGGARGTRLLVVDTSPFENAEPAEAGAVVVRRRDAMAEFDPLLNAQVARAAAHVGVPAIVKDEWIDRQNEQRRAAGQPPIGVGRTELGRIVALSAGRLQGTTVQVPTHDHHANHETTTQRAVESAAAVLTLATEQLST